MPAVLSATARAHLARAIAIAESARGATAPNPAVGCVIAHGGQIVGEGATTAAGGPHAELVALAAAGTSATGATAYVTLAPCAHHGRTPPCADALAVAGVARVVVALDDPNPVATGGLVRLAAAKVEVVLLSPDDVFATTAARQLEGFLHVVELGRPHVTLKVAQTSSGDMAPTGRRWVTSPVARHAVHRWRRAVDAVLIGSGTVLADDPRLDVRLVETARQPRPVVLDARLRTPATAQVVRAGAIVATRADAPSDRADELERRGARVVRVGGLDAGGIDVSEALVELARIGITAVLAEPGPTLAQALLDADVVDRLVLHVAGGHEPGPGRRAVTVEGRWSLERLGGAGPDAIIQLVRDRTDDAARVEAA